MLSRYTATQLTRALAVLLVLVLAASWIEISIWLRELPRDPLSPLSLVMTAHLLLLAGSIVGLLRLRPWGFYLVYLMIPLSTVLLSISFLPLVPRLFPFPLNSIVMSAMNLLVLVFVVSTHAKFRREAAGGWVPR